MTEPLITLRGDLALFAMRLLAAMEEHGEYIVHIDARRPDALRWRVGAFGAWEKSHRVAAQPIDVNVR